jgi:hypothetical protein
MLSVIMLSVIMLSEAREEISTDFGILRILMFERI